MNKELETLLADVIKCCSKPGWAHIEKEILRDRIKSLANQHGTHKIYLTTFERNVVEFCGKSMGLDIKVKFI